MVKNLKLIALFLTLVISIFSVNAQTVLGTAKTEGFQVADPSFENWSQSFNGKPALGGGSTGANTGKGLWYGANVYKNVIGIEAFGHVVHQISEAHSGNYAAKLVDTEVGAAGITETSPSWVTLGTPWAYLDGIKVGSATAGTDGGVKFTARPDTMAVWIKRVSEGTEHINLVYYSWKGTSRADSYLNKDGGCTSTTHYDEESDIRKTLDPNICNTAVSATQIGEGNFQTSNQYSDWTQIRVPIQYYTNDIPEKMNIILSASNYPEGRRNDGLFVGNYMIVDDLELIYSSKIHELRLGGEKYSDFTANKYEYTYILPVSSDVATIKDIPAITAFRSGRQLNSNELTITPAAKLGDPTIITVKAEDGSSTTKYTIYFKPAPSENSRLSNIYVNGTPIQGFTGYKSDYDVTLPYASKEAVITVDKGHEAQTVEITSCENFPCKAVVKVTAENKDYTTTYNLNLVVGPLTDNTLQNILVGGNPIPGFKPTTNSYVVELPLGTTEEPTIEAVSKYADGEQNIVITRNGLEGTSTIVVTPPSGTPRTYKITYRITESSYSLLNDIKLDGKSIAGFDPSKTEYNETLPVGTVNLPEITWVKGDNYQTVELVNEGVNGTSRITVTAQNGTKTIYRIKFSVVKSTINTLKNIFIDGVALAGFSPEVKDYEYNVNASATSRPVVTWEAADSYQVVSKNPTSELTAPIQGVTKLTVRAQDGSASVYTITFTQKLSSNSKLAGLSVAGYELSPVFNPEVTSYTCALNRGTTTVPEILVVKGDETQVVRIDENGVNGVAKITVKAQSGATTVYTISFSVAVSSDATLKDIKVSGESIEGFNSSVLEYSISLPAGTTSLPAIEAVKNDDAQRVVINRGGVNGSTTIQVIAEDGTTLTYKLNFSVEKSANATLQNIYVDGVAITGFDPEVLEYKYILAEDAAKCPKVTAEGYPGQVITITTPLLFGKACIEVTPEEGAKNIYTILFTTEKSSEKLLSDIQLDGVTIDGFDSQVNDYSVILPTGTTQMPVITYTKAAESQIVQVVTEGVNGVTKLNVMAEDGGVNTYTINFSVEKSSDSSLNAILLDGVLLDGFSKDKLEYNVELPLGTTSLPVVTYTKSNDAQQVASTIPSNIGVVTFVVVSADASSTSTYKLNFSVAKQNNANLNNIFVNNVEIDGFSSDKLDYEIDWVAGSVLPMFTYEKADATQQVIVKNSNWAGCTFVVTAQNGITQTYTVKYNVLNSNYALLSDIMFYNETTMSYESMSGFDAETLEYNIELPWRTAVLPAIQPVPGSKGQRITINEGGVDGPTTIDVLAQDGVTTITYKLNFSTEKSSDATLSMITIDGNELDGFDAGEFNYVVTLPYATKNAPVLGYTNAYKDGKLITEQDVIVSDAGLYGTSRILVVAQDGVSSSTYTITYKVADSGLENKLALLLLDGKPLELKAGVYDYEIELPLGTTEIPVISVQKLYEEQEIRIIKNPDSYVVTLISNQIGVADVTYNIAFKTKSKAYLTAINAVKLYPAFDPEVTQYVAIIDNEADITFATDENVNEISTEGSLTNKKVIKVTNKSNAIDNRTYTVYLHYSGDVIPNGEFTAWEDAAKVGVKPVGWKVPGDYVTNEDDKALSLTSVASNFKPEETVKNESDNIAVLNTGRVYLNLGGWFPGMMSLSGMSIALANEGKTSTSISGDGIPFKNTPDNYEVRYNAVSSSNIDNNSVQYGIQFNTMDPVVKTKTTFDNKYVEEKGSFNWKGVKSPSYLNIWFCAGKSLNASDYGYYNNVWAVFNDKWTTCSTMKVDYIRFSYSSAISAINVNGVSATKSGNAFTANIDVNYVGRPELDIVGEVTDQAYDIVWTEESDNLYKANIRSYAEDGTYTDYTLTVNVNYIASTDNNLTELSVNGTSLDLTSGEEFTVKVPSTYYQFPDVTAKVSSALATTVIEENEAENTLSVKVAAENGDVKVYTIKLVKDLSNDVTLKNITLEGYEIAFDPATLTYEVNLGTSEIPAISYEKALETQTVDLSVTETTTIKVIAENGVDTQTYAITFVREKEATTALLNNLAVLNANPFTFDANTFDYTAELPNNEFAQINYEKAFACDALNSVQTDDEAVFNVFNENQLSNTYTIKYDKILSTNALLENILINGVGIDAFDPLTTDYDITIEKDEVIDIEPVLSEEGQTVEVTFNKETQIYTITVTAENTVFSKEYTVTLVEIIDKNADLKAILINGEDKLGEFDADLKYTYLVKAETPKWNRPNVPTVEVVAGSEGQTIDVEINGLDKISYITVTAEDGITEKVYELTLEEEKSSYAYLNSIAPNYVELGEFIPNNADYTIEVPVAEEIPVITYQKGDAFQKVEEIEEGNVYKLVVTAENGDTFTYSITFSTNYTSNSSLAGITLDGELIEKFSSDKFDYNVTLPVGTRNLPEIGVISGADGQDIQIRTNGVNGVAEIVVTADDGVTKSTYTIAFSVKLSEVATLLDILLDGVSLEGFQADKTEYTHTLPVGTRTWPIVSWVAGDEYQTITPSEEEIDMYNKVVKITTLAEDGINSKTYTVNLVVEKSGNDKLKDIQLDNVSLEEFKPENNSYKVELPVGTTEYPTVTYTAGDEYQTINTEVSEAGDKVTIKVQAENGNERTYTVEFVILHSSNADLSAIYVNYELIEGFTPAVAEYNYVLPYGSTELPEVTYDMSETWQVVTVEENGVNGDYKINVLAEDGKSSKTYIIHFSVAKSNNALLSSILVNEEEIPNFDAEVFEYTYSLPYGETQTPAVDYVKAVETQVVTIKESTSIADATTITVVAEDGETTNVYTIKWENKESDNATLTNIYVDGKPLDGFDPADNEYEVVLPYGTTELPVVTVEPGDADQTAVVEMIDNNAVISVTAEDGTPNEYIVRFVIEKSSENRLKNIWVKGVKLEGFNPEVTEYSIVYPNGTPEEEVARIEDLTYELFDPIEQVTLLNEGMLLMLQVTAQNGDIRIYVIEQSIALSNNTQLDDILVNGKSLDGFSPDILEYTYILPYGSVSVPEDITYVTSDSTQTVSVSINALGTPTEIFVTAEDGTKAVYRIHFVPDDFNPGTEPTEDNVCVTSLPDGKWKFTTNCSNVSIMLSTLDGKIMLLKNLELVDVNVPNICSPEAEGYVYDIPDGLIIAYYFIHNNKKVVESGKIRSLMYK
ncbi:MAG: hypothetical protein IKA83_08640 [Paludibacteraceae bacterium]|nr:hypothetical protein [Paludibacteraceae bacterium]